MIFYFSGTGNTRWAAKALEQQLNEELIYIPDVMNGDCKFRLKEDEMIGFVFPIHGWRPPLIVRRFIRKLRLEDAEAASHHYVYALCSAGDSIGLAMNYMERELADKQLHADAEFSLIMPESYVGLPFMDVDPKERETAKKKQAEADLAAYIDDIKNRRTGIRKLKKGPIPGFLSGPVGGFFEKHLITDKPFHVVSSRCVKCGICADVCPTHDIIGGLGSEPQWKHEGDCLSCFTCYHHCPHHAIEYGGRTKHKGQYFFGRTRR